MKKITRNFLIGMGIVSIGFMAYTLWDAYIQNKIQLKKKADAEKTAAFIARRKAYAQAKRDYRGTEKEMDLNRNSGPEKEQRMN